MGCGVFEVFTVVVIVIAIAVDRTDVERMLNEGDRVAHHELSGYLEHHYPHLDAYVSHMLLRDAYKTLADHFEVSFKLNDEMPVIASRILKRAQTKLYADRSGDD